MTKVSHLVNQIHTCLETVDTETVFALPALASYSVDIMSVNG